MTLPTAQKDGRYITALHIDGGPSVVRHVTQADPFAGWADLLVWDENGRVVYNRKTERPLTRRVYGKITYVDTREGE